MSATPAQTTLIGFGEAARAFVEGAAPAGADFVAYDIKTDAPATRGPMLAAYEAAGIAGAENAVSAVSQAGLILSLVTADQALAAAESVATALRPGALYCDMNSVAPQTKRDAAAIIARGGGHYVDVAVMAPVRPKRAATPLLVSGSDRDRAETALRAIGFGNVRCIDGAVGAASAIKMIRSVMVKGLEALSAECVLAAEAAGVRGEVIASLDASWPGADWAGRADYNLDRMLIHGARRAAEMDEVVKTLDQLGCAAAMSRSTILWQRDLGEIGGAPDGLLAKLQLIRARKAKAA